MTVSPEQLQELLQYCTEFGRSMLESAGDFYPFGATLPKDGKVSAVGGYNGEERPNGQEIYRLLGDAFAANAKDGAILAAALAANVNIPQQFEANYRDGLRVHLEAAGYSRFIYMPYKLNIDDNGKRKFRVEFAPAFSVEVAPTYFAATGNR